MKKFGIAEKVAEALARSPFHALVAVGADNAQYLSGAALPILYLCPETPLLVLWPKGEPPACVCPVEWEATVRELSWIEEFHPYERAGGWVAAVDALAPAVRRKVGEGGRLGVDLDRAPWAFLKELRSRLGGVELLACDALLRELRMMKTPEEAALLEEVAHRTDHGILGAAHHVIVTVPRTEMALAEDIRVHCLERGLDTVGHHSMAQASSGVNAKRFWPLPSRFCVGWEKALAKGEVVRMEMRGSIDGYWSDAARLMVMGDPAPEQWRAYRGLVALREEAVRRLEPGARCGDVSRAVRDEAARLGIELVRELGVGHGVGVTAHEAPYLVDGDDTVLRPGMVLVVDPVVRGPGGEIMRSKDTVLITDAGCRIIGWYKDWREPYLPAYTL